MASLSSNPTNIVEKIKHSPPSTSLQSSYFTRNMEVPIVHDKLYLCKQFQPSHCLELHNAAEVASCLDRWNKICDQNTQEILQKQIAKINE
jgi:hypothetical protein